ncbi:MAG: tRNA pseudouridine13 synthase [archaeon GW2011_AR17]|nr:MAG: tRNA pseudouridine13 synthase [archaeon GW2011_AR17]MBS3154339.1 tRNA pseudouridine(13) synthase TruD [Candidatus Woesearchaeota archaeon]HIH15277.1 tRNA pseudouridine(13) synthase TruD [Nanoarchaeota archaeon]HIH58568.1 tRNA pseudouridine(13) synthase TruD [Nanoarchaeota archaeon]HII13763.1 tRNA pseudouridine(13) synthase TruD [Nanoarchaeota archaeon]
MKIKELPEDFIVKEVLELKVEDGSYYYYFVTKKNWNTLDVVKEISQRLHVKDVGYAGLKDRIAVTSQYISVQKKINFTLKDVKFEYLGTGKQRIFLGSLKGNAFILTLRDLEKKIAPVKEIINYFGEQRLSEKNAIIGKMLVKKQFKEACKELELEVVQNDYVGALKKSGKERLKFYLHAYQSELWNTLAEKSKKKIIPIIGYLTEGKEYDTILKEKGISKEDFILRSIPEIGVEGGERNRVVQVENFKTLSFEDDELHPGKKKQVISFYLEKGAYATTVLEALDI